MKTVAIKTLSEYIQTIEVFKTEWDQRNLWYRGVSDSNFKLIPSFYRSEFEIDCKEEHDIFNSFRLKAKLLIENSHNLDKIDWYSIMQHYGLPTRMLDWTTGSLIALFFALRDTNTETDRAVYVINPKDINWKIHNSPDIDNEIGWNDEIKILLDKYVPNIDLGEYPIAITPPHIDKRIFAQKGRFTIHGKSKKSIEEICELFSINLSKIIINESHIYDLKFELVETGITESVLFPDLEGLAREFIFEYVLD
jgi:hypothetical protein